MVNNNKTPLDIISECNTQLIHRGQNKRINIEDNPLYVTIHQKENQVNNVYYNEDKKELFAIDGLIFNEKQFTEEFIEGDLENTQFLNLVLKNFTKQGSKVFNNLHGTFSGILYTKGQLYGFKDPIGAKPLYYCHTDDLFALASELKALAPLHEDIKPIQPGCVISSAGHIDSFYYYPKFTKNYQLTSKYAATIALKLNKLVKEAIKNNIRENENINALLSGGIDSTIIVNIAKDYIKDLNVYTVGVPGSKDLFYAKKYAKKHHLSHKIKEISLAEMLEALPEVIYALETYDAALIRSAVPMYIISKEIHSDQGSSVLLTGEGGDELFGGYEYLTAYDESSLNHELYNLLMVEHKTGLQRVDRIPYHFSIEARAPLFDRKLVEFAFSIPPEFKVFKKGDKAAKKWILRKAFELEMAPEFVWRKKQKFSNGAGSQFVLRDHINNVISDEEFDTEKQITPNIRLRAKEELYYWRIFKSKFTPTIGTIEELGITSVYEI